MKNKAISRRKMKIEQGYFVVLIGIFWRLHLEGNIGLKTISKTILKLFLGISALQIILGG